MKRTLLLLSILSVVAGCGSNTETEKDVDEIIAGAKESGVKK